MKRRKLIIAGGIFVLFTVLYWINSIWWNHQDSLETDSLDQMEEMIPEADYSMIIDAGNPSVRVSPLLYGAFFEEINHAGDGGIYAELVYNRSFEDSDEYPNGWSLLTDGQAEGRMELYSEDLINPMQRQAVRLEAIAVGENGRVGMANDGYWGIRIEEGEEYRLSLFAKGSSGFEGPIRITLESANGEEVYGEAVLQSLTDQWERYNLILRSKHSSAQARLVLAMEEEGMVYFDVVSLFPRTWKGRDNGLRLDLANKVAELRPRFLRFPGGCFVEGNSPDTAYQWKTTIGDISERRTHWNLWGYCTTNGLGFHEFLQWAEDLGAEPLYVVNIGISHTLPDPANNYTAVPLAELEPLVQDVLDAIEYANGPVTSQWGALRAKNGHPEPFGLKLIEIGNENNFQAAEYIARYPIFHRAIKEQYPEITVIANMPVPGVPVEIIDEHYYSSPDWFIANANRYDTYDREGPFIYVGEYAVTQGAGRGNLHAALGEAAFMTGMERNSDIVKMSSYAPLFVNVHDRTWNPDLIVFNNERSYGTPSYYVQQMFSQHIGDVILPARLMANKEHTVSPITGAIGVGSWATQVEFADVRVAARDGTELLVESFDQGSQGWRTMNGDWQAGEGVYRQSSPDIDVRAAAGDPNWSDYTMTLKARKLGGAEGMLIMFGVQDSQNYYWWNLGGWGNTLHAIEKSVGGLKSIVGQSVPGHIPTNEWLDVRIEVEERRIRCYLNDELIHDVVDTTEYASLFTVSSLDEKTGELFIKVVNIADEDAVVDIQLEGVEGIQPMGEGLVLTSDRLTDENTFQHMEKIVPVSYSFHSISTSFRQTFPKYSVTVLRLQLE